MRRLAAVVVDGERTRSCSVAADARTRWEIGSVSKAPSGMLVVDAVERGELTAQTTLAELDPDYAGSPVSTLTVRELVRHTSGLPTVLPNPLRLLSWQLAGWDPYGATTL